MTAVGFTPSAPPPPLDFGLLCVPYYPSWDVLRRMQASEMPRHVPARESIVDMGAFFDDDDDCSDCERDCERDYELNLKCHFPARALVLYCLACLFLVAFMVHLGRPREPLRFVRDGVRS